MVLGLVLTCVLLALVGWQVEPKAILAVFARANPWLLAGALGIALVGNTLGSAEVLRQALAAAGVRASRRDVLAATLENLSLQAALPLGAGHATRAFSLVRGHGVDPKRAAVSVPILFALKLAALGVLCALGFSVRFPYGLTLAAVLCALVFTLVRRRHALHARALLGGFAAAVALTALQLVLFGVSAAALGASLPLFGILAWFPLCLVLAKLPVGWMGFGTREAAVVVLFQGQAEPAALAGAALLFGLFDQIAPGLFGLVFAPRFVRHLSAR